MKSLWISAGELSGDIQGGALLSALREIAPDIRVFGMGGDSLAKAGQENLFRIEELSLMGGVEILAGLPRIVKLLKQVQQALTARRPDAVLLIDAPEFHFRVARMAHALGIPVYYFIPPKVWAWRQGRVHFLRRYVRGVFTILPFEAEFYRRHRVNVTYVGNPLMDLMDWKWLQKTVPLPGRIGLMPGSRKKEVEKLLPIFAGMADQLADVPGLSFHCLRAPHFSEAYLRRFWTGATPLYMAPHMEEAADRYAFMRTCCCMVAASGTAVLETGLAGVPTVVAYRLHPVSYAVASLLVRTPWISLPNLILGREVFPEHIQADASPASLAYRIRQWLRYPQYFASMAHDFDELRMRCGPPGGAARAAQALLNMARA